MQILIAQDNLIDRKYLMALLAPFGDCDIAVDGREAVDAFRAMMETGQSYNLVCLDVAIPRIGGMEVLAEIRKIELEQDIIDIDRVKVLITGTAEDRKSIRRSFNATCESYLTKPIKKHKFYSKLEKLNLLSADTVSQRD
jgi:two-component system chemotaxis response regulator CheY